MNCPKCGSKMKARAYPHDPTRAHTYYCESCGEEILASGRFVLSSHEEKVKKCPECGSEMYRGPVPTKTFGTMEGWVCPVCNADPCGHEEKVKE